MFQPLRGHRFHQYTESMLRYVVQDARAAGACARAMGDSQGEGKYADQLNDAVTVLAYRQRQQEQRAGRMARQ